MTFHPAYRYFAIIVILPRVSPPLHFDLDTPSNFEPEVKFPIAVVVTAANAGTGRMALEYFPGVSTLSHHLVLRTWP